MIDSIDNNINLVLADYDNDRLQNLMMSLQKSSKDKSCRNSY